MAKKDASKLVADKPLASAHGSKWALIREDYLAQNLRRAKEDPSYTLKQCAEAHGVSYQYIRKVASDQGWADMLRERADELRREALARMQGVALFDELEIRTRQATYARLASSLAYRKLQSLGEADVKALSIKEAIELMRIGLTEERQALGIGDVVRVPDGPRDDESRVLSDTQVFAVARRVLELRRNDDGSYGTDPEQ